MIIDLELAVEWKKVDVPVLVTWGTSDPTTSADENRYLAEMINGLHPGRATYTELPGMGHGLDLWPSQREWLESVRKKQHTEFDTEFLKRVEEWVKQHLAMHERRQVRLFRAPRFSIKNQADDYRRLLPATQLDHFVHIRQELSCVDNEREGALS